MRLDSSAIHIVLADGALRRGPGAATRRALKTLACWGDYIT